ncbi:MAG: deoxyribodipyrimidine photo-lyase [Proteobacteria bacterium]|nr:deoxyribodipyrimidine photo-lyase [Pseudomonadota bacterium]MDA1083683.1 deoxyribodipyrimidine photo-lyase [Pseudomonadota bacterium]
MEALVWFRSDLRLQDNPALRNAFEQAKNVHAVFIFSNNQLKKHNEANVKIDFLKSNLFLLEEKLNKLNVPLTIIDSGGFDNDASLIEQFIEKKNIKKVFWNNQFGEDEAIRDKLVKILLDKKNIDYETYNDQIIYEPGFLKTGQGLPYSVFTPFKRKWIENFEMDFLDIEYRYETRNNLDYFSNVRDFDFNYKKTHQVNMELWPAGEDEAETRLLRFLNEKAIDYSKNRNDPILDGTSRISPYLALGIISSKKCILEALKINNFEFNSGHIGVTKWIDEIVWREFYKNIMFSFPKVSKGQPFQDYSKAILWRYNEDEFNAWKEGRTGFPIVDAAMRQLLNEGWMHNRLRMVVAMFFTKNMLHDWRLGEAYFMQNLIDGDFASNNGGWQWSSSTGTDAAPYFRIFNPITQSTNFDKEGTFIKKYVPELKDLDKSVIHNPSIEHRKYCKYPEPILDLKESRLRAIDAFKTAKS